MKIVNLVLNGFTNDSRVLKTSCSLSSFGYDVIVAAIHYDNLKEHEEVSGINVHRIVLKSKNWSKKKPIQLIKYIEYIIRFILNYKNADVLHCNDLHALTIGTFCRLFNKKLKIVYDSHEYAINDVPYESKFSIKRKYLIERLFIRFANKVIVVSDSIARDYARLYKIKKPYLVFNCPNYIEQPKKNIFRETFGIRDDQKIFLYQGGLGKGRGIEILLEYFEKHEKNENVLVCMGYGPLENLIKSKSKISNNIFFHKAMPHDIYLNYTSSADYGIAFMEGCCLNDTYCLPNKMFEYLMAGIPVITSNLFEMKRLVEQEKIGVVASENTIEGFKNALNTALQLNYAQVQKNIFQVRKKYCWQQQEKTLNEIYHDL